MDVLVLTQHLSQSHLMRRIAEDIYDHTILFKTNSKINELNLFKALNVLNDLRLSRSAKKFI
jgi:hypothetical protein